MIAEVATLLFSTTIPSYRNAVEEDRLLSLHGPAELAKAVRSSDGFFPDCF